MKMKKTILFSIAGSMDALIKEKMIKAYLNEISFITTIGLMLSFILVFIVFSNRKFLKFAGAEKI